MAGIAQSDKFARVGGSGFTWFQYRGTVVGFAQSIGFTSPSPVTDPVTVQPLNYRRPAEVLVPRAIGAGTLTITAIELWNQPVWNRLLGLENATDLADVFQLMWQESDDLQAAVVIDPPVKRGNAGAKYMRYFHGVKITDIRDDETIDITTMQINKPITMMYAYSTRSNIPQRFGNEIGYGG